MIKKYDLLVIGGGLSGLSTIYKLGESKTKIGLIELSNRLGGRIYTVTHNSNDGKTQCFEAGAGRVSQKHLRVIKLINDLGLKKKIKKNKGGVEYLMKKERAYQKVNGPCELNDTPCPLQLVKKALDLFKTAHSENRLDNYTLDDICVKYLSQSEYNWVSFAYPYDAKFQLGNARLIYKIMKEHYSGGFLSLKGGLEQIIAEIVTSIKSYGNTEINTNTRCTSVDKIIDQNSNIYYRVEVIENETTPHTIYTNNLVVAIPPQSLNTIIWNCLNLQHTHWIASYPLYRIYAIYPKNEDGNVWFKNLSRVITDNPIRYIIPINPKTGLIMISYLGGELAQETHNYILKGNSLNNWLASNLNTLFPKLNIPEPTYLQGFYWDEGVHIYKPGINPISQLEYWTRPSSDPLWVIGEAYSTHQGWMEGSLQSSELAVSQIKARGKLLDGSFLLDLETNQGDDVEIREFKVIPNRIQSDLKEISLEELKKHNTRDDSWIALYGYVYDVTDWIPNHPGGDSILKGIGKDYSSRWRQVSAHRMKRTQISKILSKYLIGKLKYQ